MSMRSGLVVPGAENAAFGQPEIYLSDVEGNSVGVAIVVEGDMLVTVRYGGA